MLRTWVTGILLALFLFSGQGYLHAASSLPIPKEAVPMIQETNKALEIEIDELERRLEVRRMEATQRQDEISENIRTTKKQRAKTLQAQKKLSKTQIKEIEKEISQKLKQLKKGRQQQEKRLKTERLAEEKRMRQIRKEETKKQVAEVKRLKLEGIQREKQRKAELKRKKAEAGRTLNPSPGRIEQIATALEIPHTCLFEDVSAMNDFFKGDLKGFVEFQFKTMGLKLISYTPLMKDIFIGKAVLRPKSTIDFNNFPRLTLCFLEVIAGKLQTTLRNESFFITEGENLTLSSLKNHTLVNPYQMKDTSFLIVSRPSLISANLANPTP